MPPLRCLRHTLALLQQLLVLLREAVVQGMGERRRRRCAEPGAGACRLVVVQRVLAEHDLVVAIAIAITSTSTSTSTSSSTSTSQSEGQSRRAGGGPSGSGSED